MKLSLYVGETRDLARSLEAIDDAERRGLHGVWLPELGHEMTVGTRDPQETLARAEPRPHG